MLWVTIRMASVGKLPPAHNSNSSVRRFSAVRTSGALKVHFHYRRRRPTSSA
jgi:hypothetical protein